MTYIPKHLRRWKRPDPYIGADWPSHFVFLGWHRDSDSVDRSNRDIARAELEKLPPWDDPNDEGSRFVVEENHWAVGWVAWIAIHCEDEAGLRAADAMRERLESYPVLSDDHLSQLEWDEAVDWWARMTVRERLGAIRASHAPVSPFAARREDFPQDDDGSLLEYLR